jgi:hypothetical protein
MSVRLLRQAENTNELIDTHERQLQHFRWVGVERVRHRRYLDSLQLREMTNYD